MPQQPPDQWFCCAQPNTTQTPMRHNEQPMIYNTAPDYSNLNKIPRDFQNGTPGAGSVILYVMPPNQLMVNQSCAPTIVPQQQFPLQIQMTANPQAVRCHNVLVDPNVKNKESKTNVYIKMPPNSLTSQQELQLEINQMLHEMGLYIPLSYPKFSFPKNYFKLKYFFVDFEMPSDLEEGERISELFRKKYEQKHGPGSAQCAKEKDQDCNNIYFEPLPYGCVKQDLRQMIEESLKNSNLSDMHWRTSMRDWSIHIKLTEGNKPPIGFCRIESTSMTPAVRGEIVNEIIRTMKDKPLKEFDTCKKFHSETTNEILEILEAKLIVKKANKSQKSNIAIPMGREPWLPNMNSNGPGALAVQYHTLQYQPSPSPHALIPQAQTPVMSPPKTEISTNYCHPFTQYSPTSDYATPRNTMHLDNMQVDPSLTFRDQLSRDQLYYQSY